MCHKDTVRQFISQGDTMPNNKITPDTIADRLKEEGLIIIKEALRFCKDPYVMILLLPLTLVYNIKLLIVHILIIVALMLLA